MDPQLCVHTVGASGLEEWPAQALVAATGTTERVVPFPGWTLPGVIGLAAATVMLKSQQMRPGERTVVAGCGPLLAAVAVGIVEGGGTVAAVVDLAGPKDWLSLLPALASRPDVLLRGIRWLRKLQRAGVPVLSRHTVCEARAETAGLRITVQAVDADARCRAHISTQSFAADCLTVGHGLVPATEVTRLLGVRHVFRAARGGWIAEHDSEFRTSRERVYVAGDAAGISGAAPAFLQGQVAGLAAARDLGYIDGERLRRRTAPLRRRLRRAERFGHAMSRIMALRPALASEIPQETVVCRCEDVTRAEIETAIAHGARDLNQLKAWTRCGMGPCQGRSCGDVVATLLAAHVGSREAAGVWTARAPLRPLDTELVTGAYGYADIAFPKAAPL